MARKHPDPEPEPQAAKNPPSNDVYLLLLDRMADAIESIDRRLGVIDQSLDNINETLKKNVSEEPSPQP